MPDFRRIGENIMKALTEEQVDLLIEELGNLRDAATITSNNFEDNIATGNIYVGKADGLDIAISFIRAMAGEKHEKATGKKN